MIRVVVFGIGAAYDNRSFFFHNNSIVELVAFIDNKKESQGTIKEGKKVYAPEEIYNLKYDAIILLSNQYFEEQKTQLKDMGISDNIIWDFYDLKRRVCNETSFEYEYEEREFNILILAYRFGLDGGSLAALHLAEALMNKRTNVVIATEYATKEMQIEAINKNVVVVEHMTLPYMSDSFYSFVEKFQFVIVNTMPMLPAAVALYEKKKPVCFWVHEGEDLWYSTLSRVMGGVDVPENLKVAFVSEEAKELYIKYFRCNSNWIVPIAIPDVKVAKKVNQDFLRISVIGANSVNKNLRLLVDSVEMLNEEYRNRIIINYVGVDTIGAKELVKASAGIVTVTINGILSREEVHKLLDETDCVVCTSLKESLSAASIEGLMHGCIVVVPDTAGISHYIRHRESGFIYKANDKHELAECLIELIEDKNNNKDISEKGKKVYERFFRYDVLKSTFSRVYEEMK